jgi:hypothetical protein
MFNLSVPTYFESAFYTRCLLSIRANFARDLADDLADLQGSMLRSYICRPNIFSQIRSYTAVSTSRLFSTDSSVAMVCGNAQDTSVFVE